MKHVRRVRHDEIAGDSRQAGSGRDRQGQAQSVGGTAKFKLKLLVESLARK